LGNVADPADERVVSVLASALVDPDPLVRGHAAWAAGRLGRPDLLVGPASAERDPEVLEELAAAAAMDDRLVDDPRSPEMAPR
jgi:HEAT repeat protein